MPRASCLMPRLPCALVAQRNALELLQGDAKDAAEGEALRETVRDADAGAAELEKIERRLAPGQQEDELTRQVLAVVRVEMQWLQVVAEVHPAERRRSSGELRQGDAEGERTENPVLPRELAAPGVLFFVREMFESHQ